MHGSSTPWLELGLAVVNMFQTIALAWLGIVARRVNGQVSAALALRDEGDQSPAPPSRVPS